MAEDLVPSQIFPKDGLNDQALAGWLQSKIFAPARKSRERLDFRWYIYAAWRDGRQWMQYNKITRKLEEPGVENWRERPVINEIFIAGRANNAIITANKPRFEVVPAKADLAMDPETGKAIEGPSILSARRSSKYLDYLFYKLVLRRKIYELVDDGFCFGNGFAKIDWDQSADEGLGEVSWIRISPFNLYPDPFGVDPNFTDHRYVDYVVARDLEEVKLKYPDKANDITPDNKTSLSSYQQLYRQTRRIEGTGNVDDVALVHETWIKKPYEQSVKVTKDQTTPVQIPSLGPDNQPTIDEASGLPRMQVIDQMVKEGTSLTVMKYKMRVIHWHNDIILKDQENPLEDNQYPFVHYSHEIVSGDFWADSGIKHAVDLNRNVNRRAAQALENANKNNNPRLVIDEGAGVRKNAIPSYPGGIIRVRRGTKVDVLPGLNIAKDTYDLMSYFTNKIQDITATHDVSRGRLPTGVTSGRQVELLQSADATILSPKVEELQDTLSIAGQKMLRRIADKYPMAKQAVVLDQHGMPESIDITPADVDSTNVRVQIVSFLSTTKAARREELERLLQLGAIDQKTFLDYYQFPDVDAIVQRTREAEQRQAELAAMSGAAAGGGVKPTVPGMPQSPLPGKSGIASKPDLSSALQ